MFASYAVFGHHRPLSAVIVVGVVLVGNMSLTFNDQLPYLVLFSVASLLLLIRSHVFDEQSEWVRRRIGDPASISSVYLRGGAAFITAAVAASFVLTQTAASAPLAGAWDGVEDSLIGISQSVSRFLPTGGSTRPLGLAFGPNTQIAQEWTTSGALAVTIRRNPTDNGIYYWRAWTYDKIDLNGWDQTTPTVGRSSRPTRASSTSGPTTSPPDGHHSFTFTVTPGEFRSATILSPQTPINVDQPTRLTTVGSDGYFATLDRIEGSGSYTVTALTPINGLGPGQVNIAALRATETNYPDEIKALYLPLPDGSLGPNAQKLEAKILDEAPSEAPIDLADQIVKELKSSTLQVRHRRPRPAVRRAVQGRVLRHLQEGLLPVLRGDDGGHPARPGCADPDRPGLPAGLARPERRHRDDPVQQRPRLGRGLLPGLRLAPVRSDRLALAVRAAADRQPDREPPRSSLGAASEPQGVRARPTADRSHPASRGGGGSIGGAEPRWVRWWRCSRSCCSSSESSRS